MGRYCDGFERIDRPSARGRVVSDVQRPAVANSSRSTAARTDSVSFLLQRAEAAVREKHDDEARRLFKAALRHAPTNDQALLWLTYLAEDGQSSLYYLAQLLDAHPGNPQARQAVRWVQRRIPTSGPTVVVQLEEQRKTVARRPRALVLGLVMLAAMIGLGWLWQLGRSPAASVQAEAAPAAPASALPVRTALPLMEVIRLVISLFTATPTPSPTPPPTPVPTPSSAWVPVVGHPQTYNLSCESRSAADLAGYWGVALDESVFLAALGTSDNPHDGFVGDAQLLPGSLPPYGYGVYAEPVAATLRAYGLDAHPGYNMGLDGLRSELLAGRPVLIWATYGMEPYAPVEWTSNDGQVSTVVPFMHTFLVTGYDEQGVFVLDAYDASVQLYPFETFLPVWDLFDQMAVTVSGPLP
jgi:uncharacterized protein YvpB